jgi:hypothetical protein
VRERGRRRSLFGERAKRLTLIQREGGDVDESDDVGRVGPERGDDVPAIGVPGDDRRAVLKRQDLPQACDIVCDGRQRELGRRDPVAGGLQALDDAGLGGAVGPGAVDEDDVRLVGHAGFLSVRVAWAQTTMARTVSAHMARSCDTYREARVRRAANARAKRGKTTVIR